MSGSQHSSALVGRPANRVFEQAPVPLRSKSGRAISGLQVGNAALSARLGPSNEGRSMRVRPVVIAEHLSSHGMMRRIKMRAVE